MPDPLEPRALGPSTLGRRGLLAGALAVGAGAALAACTSNTPPPAAAPAPAAPEVCVPGPPVAIAETNPR